jgi:outer membrane receptor protein involved in Fe transport
MSPRFLLVLIGTFALAQTALEPVRTSITVVESVEAETPASLTVGTHTDIRQVPGVNMDDRLRVIPGFSLFRRSSSLVAHPTTQGVSLRGIGPTGASRTLVRYDGIPMNDPFGGWVQWTRFSPLELDRVEVSRGAATSVFGDRAMGGAVSMFSRPVDKNRLTGSYEFGNRNTHQATGGFAHLWRRVALSANARAFTTNGYYIVPEVYSGAVDREAFVRFVAANTALDFLGGKNRFALKFDMLAEDRGNGTVARNNSTSLGTISGQFMRETANDGISLLGYHTREEFRNIFSAVAADRDSERPTTRQRVPAEAYGGGGTWRHSASRWSSIVGGDFHYVEGHSNDTVLSIGLQRVAGGTQLQHGYFGQFHLDVDRARLFAGVRYNFADNGHRFFAPSAGITAGFGVLRLRGTAYRSFRSPTLNELYRRFQVGSIVTLPNDQLEPESLWGIEGGADLLFESARLSFTVFRNSLDKVITNATIEVTPGGVLRQRQNAAEAVAQGAEAEFQYRWRDLTAQASYLFVDSTFGAGPRVPQVPRHQGSTTLTYARGKTLISAGLRAYALQFEDDRNTTVLPGFAVFHVAVERRLVKSLSATFAMDNFLNREFLVGNTGTPTIGNPRLWRAGLRWDAR